MMELRKRIVDAIFGELGGPIKWTNAEAAADAVMAVLREQEPFDADHSRFREAFEASIKSGNWPATRKGYGYRSTMTNMAWEVAYETVNRLKLYSGPVPGHTVATPTDQQMTDAARDVLAERPEGE